VGQTVQFQVRDAESAREDFRAMLDPERLDPVAGALFFRATVAVRGCSASRTTMSAPCVGPSATSRSLDSSPRGSSADRGRNFVHGFTASILLFRNGEPRSTRRLEARTILRSVDGFWAGVTLVILTIVAYARCGVSRM